MRSVAILVFACSMLAGSSATAHAAQLDGPTRAMMAPVQRWISAFNAAQTLPEDVFTDDVIITDLFPPYAWSGKTGVHAWSTRIEKGFHDPRIKNEHVLTEAPRAFLISHAGDRASFVLPSTLTYEFNGKRETDRALWLFVVAKNGPGAWSIAADTWTTDTD